MYMYQKNRKEETKCKKCNQNNRIHDRKVSIRDNIF